jgi:hypothetical protein
MSFAIADGKRFTLQLLSDKDVEEFSRLVALCRATAAIIQKKENPIIQDLLLGSGTPVVEGDAVQVKYSTWLQQRESPVVPGALIDSNADGNKLAKLKVGKATNY